MIASAYGVAHDSIPGTAAASPPKKRANVWVELKGVRSGVERRRGRRMKARDPGRRDATGKVLKERRSPRERGRMGTSVRSDRTHLRLGVLFVDAQLLEHVRRYQREARLSQRRRRDADVVTAEDLPRALVRVVLRRVRVLAELPHPRVIRAVAEREHRGSVDAGARRRGAAAEAGHVEPDPARDDGGGRGGAPRRRRRRREDATEESRRAPTHAAVACFDDDDDGAGARPRRGPRPRAADGDAAAALARRREGRRDDDRDGRARRRRRRVHRPPREANSDVDDDTSRRLDEVSLTR
eukprot:29750-Pelagococcus_subviridis.AAC.2